MSNKYGSLVKNTAIFAIGSFGSKVLSFLIVPLYTYVLTTGEYGRIDLITTAISLMLPFTTLLIQEAIIRFVMGNEISKEYAITNSFVVFVGGIVITLLLWPCFYNLFGFEEFTGIFVLMLILNSFTQIFSQYLRAINENIKFTLNGIINTLITLSCNVIFLVYFRLGIEGYFYSNIIAQVISIIYISYAGKIFGKIAPRAIDLKKLWEMLRFSIPLIPNALMWWVMSAGDKYIINYYLGDSANGLYSLAMKMPMIISMMYTVYYQAWQMSAIQEKGSKDAVRFYDNVYVITNLLLGLIVCVVIIAANPLYTHLMDNSFISSWRFVPLLALATYFNCGASFFAIVYTLSKQSHKAFYTTFAGAGLNILISFFLARFIGIYGVAIGTIIGFLTVELIRMRDAKKELGMGIDAKRSSFMVIVLSIQASLTSCNLGNVQYIVGIISFLLIVALYRNELLIIVRVGKIYCLNMKDKIKS